LEQEHAWFIAVPKRQEFTEPPFHFGERVKWKELDETGECTFRSGRIIGLSFLPKDLWQCQVWCDDANDTHQPTFLAARNLKLVKDSVSIRSQIEMPQSSWKMTAEAAELLGLTADQLRKLRRYGLFKQGHHFRDTSVPGSGKPRWQWHVERCTRALAIPPEQRG
jgi:hypothetical protein